MRVGVEDVECFQTLFKASCPVVQPSSNLQAFVSEGSCFIDSKRSALRGIDRSMKFHERIVKHFRLALLITLIFKTINEHW